MTKPEVLTTIVESGLTETKKGASELLEKVTALVDLFEEKLEAGDKVKLGDRLVIEKKHKEARVGRNPKTGESVVVPAHKAVTVKLSKHFKDAIR